MISVTVLSTRESEWGQDNMENKKKRIVVQNIENKRGKTFNNYADEFDYLIDDYDSLSAVPIEVKSGKDYTVHSALNTFVKNEDYHIKKAFVVSNERNVTQNGKITYIPIYYIMFFSADSNNKNLQF